MNELFFSEDLSACAPKHFIFVQSRWFRLAFVFDRISVYATWLFNFSADELCAVEFNRGGLIGVRFRKIWWPKRIVGSLELFFFNYATFIHCQELLNAVSCKLNSLAYNIPEKSSFLLFTSIRDTSSPNKHRHGIYILVTDKVETSPTLFLFNFCQNHYTLTACFSPLPHFQKTNKYFSPLNFLFTCSLFRAECVGSNSFRMHLTYFLEANDTILKDCDV